MATSEKSRRWWGWGSTDMETPPAAGFMYWLKEHVSPWPDQTLPVPHLESMVLRPSFMPVGLEAELADALGVDHLISDPRTRLLHGFGRSYKDLIRIRLGNVIAPPDVVVYPAGHDQVRAVIDIAGRYAAAVVPYGGGTSVVGGLEQEPDIHPLICVDLARMNRILELDKESLVVKAEAGILGPDMEEALNRQGLTLGHFPQSFEFSTLGGWIATRGAGHKSTRYGKIEDMVLALRMVSPAGDIQTPQAPHPAAGGDPASLLVGSEGAFGIITEADMKVRSLPDSSWFGAFLFPNFHSGMDAIREIMAKGLTPATIRLSDAVETSALMAEAASKKKGWFHQTLLKQLLPRYLHWKGIEMNRVCLLIIMGEGLPAEIKYEKKTVSRIIEAHGGVSAGASPARAWHETRYQTPYLRDELITAGLMTETLETSVTWNRLEKLQESVRTALEEALAWSGVRGVVMAHLSHAYPEGANIYFTFMASIIKDHEEEQWHRAKVAATRAIIDGGGALSHHHGVGRDHKPWLEEFCGSNFYHLMKAAKSELDPLAILNPGVPFDPEITPDASAPRQSPFSNQTRALNFERFENETFDLAVIGGGIVGAGVAYDAGLRGLSVALVEKEDFGSGTSGKSSRMVHGGLRYLKMLDLKLVREALGERYNLLRMAPHLVKPVKHVLPIYKGEGDSRTILHFGLWGYDTLAGEKRLPEHRNLSRDETLALVPSLSEEGLEGGLLYYDGLTDDARLTLETIKAASRAGAAIANYSRLVGLDMDETSATVRLVDTLSGRERRLKARFVVNATGVWADRVRLTANPDAEPLLRPAKGIHISYPRNLTPIEHVVILKGSDGRPLFAVPVGRTVYVGTTDTDFDGDLDHPHAEPEEVDYLIEAVNRIFDQANLTRDQVTSSWAGIRPLISVGKEKNSSTVSREHEIRLESQRLCTVCGGKLTTFRSMAAQTVDLVVSVLTEKTGPPSSTANLPLCGVMPDVTRDPRSFHSPEVITRLNNKYGPQADFILQLARSPRLNVLLDQEIGLISAEVFWAVKGEMAMTLVDAMVRRLGLMYITPDNGQRVASKVARVMAPLLGWDSVETDVQIKKYHEFIGLETSYRIK